MAAVVGNFFEPALLRAAAKLANIQKYPDTKIFYIRGFRTKNGGSVRTDMTWTRDEGGVLT
jgi:hypothetical protein